MKVVCLSDTHGKHGQLLHKIPRGDVLVHTGDFQGYGRPSELIAFNQWLGELPHKHKIVIAGNHDKTAYFESINNIKTLFSNAYYLEDSSITIGGIKFYGSPWTPMFYDWYFMLNRGKAIKKKWDQIPEDTDVLLTHGPPLGKLDYSYSQDMAVGCDDLRKKVEEVKPKYHIFGHLHESNGKTRNEHTVFINASICNRRYYKPVQQPKTFIL